MEAANSGKSKNVSKPVIPIQEPRIEDSPYQQEQDELNAATASIMLPIETTNGLITTINDVSELWSRPGIKIFMIFLIFQPDSPNETENIFTSYHEILPLLNNPNDELRRSAGEILNGVRRNVEVQIMQNELQSYSILSAGELLGF